MKLPKVDNPHKINDRYRLPRPSSIKEVPKYLTTLITTLAKRLFYIYKLVWKAKKSLLFAMLIFALFNGFMPVIGATITAMLLNTLALCITGSLTSFNPILFWLIINGLFLFLRTLLNRFYQMNIALSGEKVSDYIRQMIMNKSREIDMMQFDSPEFYAKLENANHEAGNRPVQILGSSFEVVSNIISMISFIVILTTIAWWSPLLIIVCAIPSGIVNYIYRQKRVNYMWRRAKDRREMNYYSRLMVDKDVVKEIRLCNTEDKIIHRYQTVFERYYQGLKSLIVGENTWQIITTLVSAVVHCFILVFVAQRVYMGIDEIGSFSLYSGAVTSIATGMATLVTTTATIYEGTLYINNLIDYMNETPHIVPLQKEPLHPLAHTQHTIEFRDVSFQYTGSDHMVLQNINFTIHPGEAIVLVGLNGAGKTTLIKLLTRLYDPTGGTIYFDGKDIREYDVEELYSLFGIVFQDYGKYAMTIKDNIAFTSQELHESDNERVIHAAKMAEADHFIDNLSLQYDTPLTRWFEETGTELSIGQWQKLSIARAFYKDADILILDEPTASLDALAEQAVFEEFNKLRNGKTSLFVSHRLSSATMADRILVLENGKIVEEGSHKDLMSQKGIYYHLFSTQAKRYQEEKPSH